MAVPSPQRNMLDGLRKKAIDMALGVFREKFVNPRLEDIGTITAISFRDKKIYMTLVLNGLDDRPIELSCANISIAADGSSLELSGFTSNMAFVENALNRFAPQSIDVPEGKGRVALRAAKCALGL